MSVRFFQKTLLLLLFLHLLVNTQTTAQTAGDYRSVSTGNWITLSTWQRYSGTAWLTPTTTQGYPGQNTGTGAVLIQAGHTITIGTGGITTQAMGKLTISATGQLYLTGSNSTVNFSINTPEIDIISGGTIYFANKARLSLTTDAVVTLAIASGGLIGSCNNNDEIYIGLIRFAACAGAPGDVFTFAQLMAMGGTLNAKPTSNSPLCQGSTINLTGNYAGAIGTTPTYTWTVTAPGGGITTYTTKDVSISSAVTGTYSAKLTVTTVLAGTTYSNSETIQVVVNPLPTLTGATQAKTVCDASPATIHLTGLVPSNTFELYYTINSGSTQTVTGLVSSATGTSDFTTTTLYVTNNGQTLRITGIKITNPTTNCAQTFTQDVTLSVWTTGGGTWTGTTSSDWNTASNWCGGIPTSTTDVYIPPTSASVLNQPVIGTAGAICKDLTIASGATLTINESGLLNIKGNWSNNGTFTPNTGSVSFTGSSAAQTIGGTAATTFYNLTINNTYSGGGVKAGQDFTVNGQLNLTAANPSATVGALEMVTNYNGYPGTTTTNPIVSYILTMGANATTIGQGDVTGKIYRSSLNANTSYTFGNQFATYSYTVAPTDVLVTVTIGTAYGVTSSWGDPNSVKRSYEMVPTGGTGARVTMGLHYLESELNGNTEALLVTGDYDIGGGSPLGDEHGRSSYDFTNNYIGLSGVPIAYFIYNGSTHDWRTVFTLHNYYTGFTQWDGSSSSSWMDDTNWSNGTPGELMTAIIPDASTTPNDPILPAGKTIGGMQILSGGILNLNGQTITLAGYNYNGWEDQSGLSNYTGSTVIFSNSSSNTAIPVSGIPNFNNVTINSGCTVVMGTNCYMGISGTITNNGTWQTVVNGQTTVEYKGGDQTVVVPDLASNTYSNLILSGTGTKTMPTSAMTITGDFTLGGSASVTAGNAMTIGGDFTLGSGTTFNAGAYTHSLTGDWTNNGATFTPAGSTIGLNGTTAQTIGGSASTSFNNLTVNNAAGVALGKEQTVDGTLNLTNGIVTTTGYTLTIGCDGSITNAGTTRYIHGKLARSYCNSGSKSFPVGKDGNYRELSLEYTALTGTSIVTAEQMESTISGSLPSNITVQTGRHWVITQAGGTGYTYTLTLNGSPFIQGSGSARILQGDGSTNTAQTATFSDPNFTAAGLTSFSNFAVGDECTPPNITGQPANDATCSGSGSADFTVTATVVSGTPTYQWEESTTGTGGPFVAVSNGGVYSNATTATLTITNPPISMNGYAYRVVISRDCGSSTTSDGNAVLTVNALPTITLGANPSVCYGTTSAGLSYSSATGSPDQYTITWDDAAHTAGFADVGYTTLPSSPISLTIPLSVGTFYGNLTVRNSGTGCVSETYPFSVTVRALPQGSLSGNTVCSGGTGQLTWTATEGTGPYTVVYNDGTADRTETNVVSGTPFNVYTNPSVTTNYTLVSVTGLYCPRSSGFTGGTATVTVLISTTLTWDGSVSNDWNNPANWTPEYVPVSCTDVVIPFTGITNFPTMSSTASCNSITLESGATVLGNINLTVAGTSTVKRDIPLDMNWHFLASPVTAQPIWPQFATTPTGSPLSFGTGTWNWDFYYWNPNANVTTDLYWVNLRKNNDGVYNDQTIDASGSNAGFGATVPPVFTVGRGYLSSYDDGWTTGSPVTHNFTGSLNSGTVGASITFGANPWNLVGNPYPSSIDWKASIGWNRSALETSGSGYDYWIYNGTAGNYGVCNSVDEAGTNGTTRNIASIQAFFVKAVASGTLSMTPDVMTHSTQSWLKEAAEENNTLHLRLTTAANPYSDEMILKVNPEYTDGGSDKFWSLTGEAPEIYSIKGDNNYSIDRRSAIHETTVVELGIKAGVAAGHTLTVTGLNSFSAASVVTLEDLKTGTFQKLNDNNIYTFNAVPGDSPIRLKLHFGGSYTTPETSGSGGITVYSDGTDIIIRNNLSGTSRGQVTVFDLLGRPIRKVNMEYNMLRINMTGEKGYFIVNVVTQTGSCNGKVFLK